MCHYWLGTTEERSPLNFYPEATPGYNSLSARDTDLRIGFSRSAHRYEANLMKRVAPSKIQRSPYLIWVTFRGAERATDAMQGFVGLTEKQRREAHLYRAFNCFHHGDYREAARDPFYAQQVDASYDISASLLDEEDRDIYEQIEKCAVFDDFSLAEHHVPLLDSPWKGDPHLWIDTNAHHRVLMKLFPQRYDKGPDGELGGTPENLASRYALEGITWRHDGWKVVATCNPVD
ncbi:hypothetical protein PG988_015426 [Apiospora saccharicola]